MSIMTRPATPARIVRQPAEPADPQLNVILAALGAAFIVGALIFSGSGQGTGLLFILGSLGGIDVAIAVSSRWARAVLLAGLVGITLGLTAGAWLASVFDAGILVGAIIGTAATGSCDVRRIPAGVVIGAGLAGVLIGLGLRVAIA